MDKLLLNKQNFQKQEMCIIIVFENLNEREVW